MMSPAAYQPKPDVADVEMVDGGMGGGDGGLTGEPSRKKVLLAVRVPFVVCRHVLLVFRACVRGRLGGVRPGSLPSGIRVWYAVVSSLLRVG